MDSKSTSNVKVTILYTVILLIFYSYMQGYYKENRIISVQTIVALMAIIVLLYAIIRVFFYIDIEYERTSLFNTAFVFWIWEVIVTIANYEIQTDFFSAMLNMSFWIALLFLFMYYFNIQEKNNLKTFNIITFVAFLIFAFKFFKFKFTVMDITNVDPGAVNAIYYVLLMLPLVLINRDKKIKFSAIIITVFLAMISNKRTALVALVFAVFVYYFFENNVNERKNLSNYFALLAVCLMGVYSYEIVLDVFNIDIFDRFKNIADDGGSGRIYIYKEVWNAFNNEDIFVRLFGHGFNAVYLENVSNTSAHSDFLEVLYDFGMVGLVLYLRMIYVVIKKVFVYKKSSNEFAGVYAMSVVMFIIMSLTSHVILYPTYFIFLLIVWTIAQCAMEKEKFIY